MMLVMTTVLALPFILTALPSLTESTPAPSPASPPTISRSFHLQSQLPPFQHLYLNPFWRQPAEDWLVLSSAVPAYNLTGADAYLNNTMLVVTATTYPGLYINPLATRIDDGNTTANPLSDEKTKGALYVADTDGDEGGQRGKSVGWAIEDGVLVNDGGALYACNTSLQDFHMETYTTVPLLFLGKGGATPAGCDDVVLGVVYE